MPTDRAASSAPSPSSTTATTAKDVEDHKSTGETPLEELLTAWVDTLQPDDASQDVDDFSGPPEAELLEYELVERADDSTAEPNDAATRTTRVALEHVQALVERFAELSSLDESIDEQLSALETDVMAVVEQIEDASIVDDCVRGLMELPTCSELADTTGLMADMLTTEQFSPLICSVVDRIPSSAWLVVLRLGLCVERLTGEVVVAGSDEWIDFWTAVFGSHLDNLTLLLERLELLLYLEAQRSSEAGKTSDVTPVPPIESADKLLGMLDFVRAGVQPTSFTDLPRLAASQRRRHWLSAWSQKHQLDICDGSRALTPEQADALLIYYLECIEERCCEECGTEWGDALLKLLMARYRSKEALEAAFSQLFGVIMDLPGAANAMPAESRELLRQRVDGTLAGLANRLSRGDANDEDELRPLALDEIIGIVRQENVKLREAEQLSDDKLKEIVRLTGAIEENCNRQISRGCVDDILGDAGTAARLAVIGATVCLKSRERTSRTLKIRSVQWLAIVFAVLARSDQLDEDSSNHGLGSKLIQMQTGEGKALVIVVVAAFLASQGHTVDIVTNNDQLARDAVRDYGYIYAALSLSCSALTRDAQEMDAVRSIYSTQVIYGTLLLFAADHLQEVLYGKQVTDKRNRDVLIIDEVDAVLIDRGTDCNMLCATIAGSTKLFKAYGLVHQMTKTYHKHNENVVPSASDLRLAMKLPPVGEETDEEEEVSEPGSTAASSDEPEMSTSDGGRNNAGSGEIEHHDSHANPETELVEPEYVLEEDEIPAFFRRMVSWKLPSYIQNSSRVLTELRDGRDYFQQGGAVVPLDSVNSGEIMFSSTYSDGVQQFMQLQHQIHLHPEGLPATFLSNIGMINLYNRMIGLTATLGDSSDREYVREALRPGLQPSFLFLPRYIPRRFVMFPPVYCDTVSEMEVLTYHHLSRAVEQRRSVLLICADTNDGKKWYEQLQQGYSDIPGLGRLILYLTNDSPEAADRVADELEPGDVVVTTNFGSRGTDYKNHPLVVRNGGLLCIRISLPANDRVKTQGDGRAGRAGQPGSAIVISSLSSVDSDFMTRAALYRELQTAQQREASEDQAGELAWARLKDELFFEFVKLHHHAVREIRRDRKTIALHANGTEELACLRARFALFLDELNCSRRSAILQNTRERIPSEQEVRKQWKTFVSKIEDDAKANGVINNPFSLILRANDYAKLANAPKQRLLVDFAIRDVERALEMDRTNVEASAEMNLLYLLAKKLGNRELSEYRDKIAKHLKSASSALERDIKQVASLVALVIDPAFKTENRLVEQLNGVLNIYQILKTNCDEQLMKISEFGNDSKLQVTWDSFLQDDPFSRGLFFESFDPLGFQGLLHFNEKKKWKFSWEAFAVVLLGALELAAGVGLMIFGFGGFGVALIAEAIGDLAQGIEGLVTGSFSLKAFFTDKAISIAISLACGGILKCCRAVARQGVRQTLLQLKNAGVRAFKAARRMAWQFLLHPQQALLAGKRYVTSTAKEFFFRLKTRVLAQTSLRKHASLTMREAFRNGWVKHKNQVFRVVASKVVVKGVEVSTSEGLRLILEKLENDLRCSIEASVSSRLDEQALQISLAQFWSHKQHEFDAVALVRYIEQQFAKKNARSPAEQFSRRFARKMFEKMTETRESKLGRIGHICCWALEALDLTECVNAAIELTSAAIDELDHFLTDYHRQVCETDPEYTALWKDKSYQVNHKLPDLHQKLLARELARFCTSTVSGHIHRAANMVVSRAIAASAERAVAHACHSYIKHKGQRFEAERQQIEHIEDKEEQVRQMASWQRRCDKYLADEVISRQIDFAETILEKEGPLQSRVLLHVLGRLYGVPIVLQRDGKKHMLGSETDDNEHAAALHFDEHDSGMEMEGLGQIYHVTPAANSGASGYIDLDDMNCVVRSFYFQLRGANATDEEVQHLREIALADIKTNTGAQLLSWMYRGDPFAAGRGGGSKKGKKAIGAEEEKVDHEVSNHSTKHTKGKGSASHFCVGEKDRAMQKDSNLQRQLGYMIQFVASREGAIIPSEIHNNAVLKKRILDFDFNVGEDQSLKSRDKSVRRVHYDGDHGHPNMKTPAKMKDSMIPTFKKADFSNYMRKNMEIYRLYVSGLSNQTDVKSQESMNRALDTFDAHFKLKRNKSGSSL